MWLRFPGEYRGLDIVKFRTINRYIKYYPGFPITAAWSSNFSYCNILHRGLSCYIRQLYKLRYQTFMTLYAYIEGILPKGPYLLCVSMAGRALSAGHYRYVIWISNWCDAQIISCFQTWQHGRQQIESHTRNPYQEIGILSCFLFSNAGPWGIYLVVAQAWWSICEVNSY